MRWNWKKISRKKKEELKEKLKEEQRKIEEIKNKVKEINEIYEKKIEIIKSEEMELIIKEYNEKKDYFNLEETRIYNNEKIDCLLNQILDNKIISKIILNKLNIYIEEIKKSLVEINHLNILLVGPSGVWKSTLINAILELKDEAKTGIGLPQTTEINCFSSEKSDFLRLYDSRGTEKGKDFDIDKIYLLLKEFILKQLETKDPNKYIHCIWYCWQGTRFEESEVKIINKLSELYTFKKLPIIIVYTNAIDQNQVKSAKDIIKNTYNLENDIINFSQFSWISPIMHRNSYLN